MSLIKPNLLAGELASPIAAGLGVVFQILSAVVKFGSRPCAGFGDNGVRTTKPDRLSTLTILRPHVITCDSLKEPVVIPCKLVVTGL